MVDTVESRYQDALVAHETLHEKVHTGIGLLEGILSEFETRAYRVKEKGLRGTAESLMGEGRKIVDEGLEKAREVVDEGFERAKKAAGTVEEHIENAIARAKKHGLIRYEDLPTPWRVNPHIVKGYRFTESKVECVQSMFGLSNETVNIWSHAIGLLIVLSVAFYFYPSSHAFSLSTNADVFIAACFFFAACKCLVCSTMWHTMNSVADQTLLERFACVDYTGISLLIAASIMTADYTAFYCEPVSRWVYMGITAALGLGGCYSSLASNLQSTRYGMGTCRLLRQSRRNWFCSCLTTQSHSWWSMGSGILRPPRQEYYCLLSRSIRLC